jgi:hypothetical protein
MEMKMNRQSIITITEQAHQLRAEEMQRIYGILYAKLGVGSCKLCTLTLVALTAFSEVLRPIFSWVPRHRRGNGSRTSFGAA